MKGRQKNEHIWRGNRIGGLSGITEFVGERKLKGSERTESRNGG